MSRKQSWKKSIRAEVASALAGNQTLMTEQKSAPMAKLVTSNLVKNKPEPTSTEAPNLVLRQDLLRILWISLFLLASLVVLSITEQRSGWLGQSVHQLTDRLTPVASPSPSPTATESPQT